MGQAARGWPRGAAFAVMATSMLSTHLGAAFAKTLFPLVGAAATSALRLALAAIVLVALFRPSLRLSARSWRIVLAYGVAIAGMNSLFYLALQKIHLGVAVTLEFSGPLALAALSSRRRIDFLWIGVAMVGVALLFPPGQMAQVDPVGAALAVASGACWGCYIFFGRKAGLANGHSMAALATLVAALIAVPIALAQTAPAVMFQPAILPLALAVAILSAAVPYTLEIAAMARMPTRTSGTVMSLQPAFAALVGFVVLGERLTLPQAAAICAVMIASIGAAVTAGFARAAPPDRPDGVQG